jgi:hypothetical protein
MKPESHFRYQETSYVPGRGYEERVIDAAELRQLDLESFDFAYVLVQGYYAYRGESGERQKKPLDGAGLGESTFSILRALQLNPGEFLTPRDIAELVGNHELYEEPNLLAAAIRRIRAALGESGERQRFVITRRNGGYALMWPENLSWIWIERVPNPPA